MQKQKETKKERKKVSKFRRLVLGLPQPTHTVRRASIYEPDFPVEEEATYERGGSRKKGGKYKYPDVRKLR